MPIYSYACSNCGHKQDHLLKMIETLSVCPSCLHPKYEKQLTAPNSISLGKVVDTAPCGATAKEVQSIGCGGNCSCH